MEKIKEWAEAALTAVFALVALYQLGVTIFRDGWYLTLGVIILFALVYYIEKAANIAMVVLTAGVMVTAIETSIHVTLVHVVAMVLLGLIAGYHLKLVEQWKVEGALVEDKQRGKVLVCAYVIASIVGICAVAYMPVTWVNATLTIFFAMSLYESYCTYKPKASDIIWNNV